MVQHQIKARNPQNPEGLAYGEQVAFEVAEGQKVGTFVLTFALVYCGA